MVGSPGRTGKRRAVLIMSCPVAYHATPVAEAVGTITGLCGMEQASASTTISDH